MRTDSAPSDYVLDKRRENSGSLRPAIGILISACLGAALWELTGLRALVVGIWRAVWA